VSKSAAHIAAKFLKLKPCRTTVFYQLLPPEAEERINYWRRFQQSVSCFILMRHGFISAVI
jgi:hypothetical protein